MVAPKHVQSGLSLMHQKGSSRTSKTGKALCISAWDPTFQNRPRRYHRGEGPSFLLQQAGGYSIYPNSKRSISDAYLLCLQRCESACPPWALQHHSSRSSLLLMAELLHFDMEDEKEWWTSLWQWRQTTLSSSSLMYHVVRHLLCLSSWLILCFSAPTPKKCQSRCCQSQRMTSHTPAWEGIGSLPEIHIVQGLLQVSLNSSVAFSRAGDRETVQLGKGFMARQWVFFMVWHFIVRWCVVMSPVSHHEGWSPASQFSAPLFSTGFPSTRDLALMKLRYFFFWMNYGFSSCQSMSFAGEMGNRST